MIKKLKKIKTLKKRDVDKHFSVVCFSLSVDGIHAAISDKLY